MLPKLVLLIGGLLVWGQALAHVDTSLLNRTIDSLQRVIQSRQPVLQRLQAHHQLIDLIENYIREVPYAYPRQHILHHWHRYLRLSYRYRQVDSTALALNELIAFWNRSQEPLLANRYALAFEELLPRVRSDDLKVRYWLSSSVSASRLGWSEVEATRLELVRHYIESEGGDRHAFEYAKVALPYYQRIGQPQQLTVWLQQRMARYENQRSSPELVVLSHALAHVYEQLRNNEGHLKYLKLLAHYAEIENKPFERAAATLRIGNLHRMAREYPEAMAQYEIAQRLLDSLGRVEQQQARLGFPARFYDASVVQTNLAFTAFFMQDYAQMARWAEVSLRLAQRWGFFDRKVLSLASLAKAQSHLKTSPAARQQLIELEKNDTLRQSAQYQFIRHMALGYVYLQEENYDKSRQHYEAAQSVFTPGSTPRRSLELHEEIETALYRCYAALRRVEPAYRHLKAALAWRDSLDQNQQEADYQRLLVQHELEAKELEIEALTRKQSLAKARSQQTQLVIWVLVGAVLLLAGLGVLLLGRIRQRRHLQQQLLTLNALQIERREELASAYAEIAATLQQVQEQNQVLELQQLRIEDSLTYAKRIQNAILPDAELLGTHLSEHLILFRPADIVSGDYYWWERQGHQLLVGVLGCGRQGVPGAFVGAALIQLLDRVAQRAAEGSLAQLLDRLETEYRRRTTGGDAFTPFSLGLVRIDLSSGQLEYAGAGVPLFVQHEQRVELLAGRPDLIGAPPDEAGPFKRRMTQLETGDRVFLVTSGLLQQPNEEDGTPLGADRLAQILERTARNDLHRQGDLLHLYLERWMGAAPQQGDWLAVALEW